MISTVSKARHSRQQLLRVVVAKKTFFELSKKISLNYFEKELSSVSRKLSSSSLSFQSFTHLRFEK